MLSFILRGITTALLVTVLTLFAGIVWGAMGFGGLSNSGLLDIGLMASCIIGGFRAAKESGEWLAGGITGVGYVTVGTLLLALFLPIRTWGFIQVLGEGAVIGLIAGAFGAGGAKGRTAASRSGWRTPTSYRPSYAGYGNEDQELNHNSYWDYDDDNLKQQEQKREEEQEQEQVQEEISSMDADNDRDEEFPRIDSEKGNLNLDPEIDWPWNSTPQTENRIEHAPSKLEGSTKEKPWWE